MLNKRLLLILTFMSLLALSYSKLSMTCHKDDDCPQLYHCEGQTADEKGDCKHKTLWPMYWVEWIGFVTIAFAAILANAVGLGGGSIYVPLLLIFFYFQPTESAPLSQTLIFGGVVSGVTTALNMKHPYYPRVVRPLVHFEAAMVLQPGMLLGARIGKILNTYFPPAAIYIGLTITLILSAIKTLQQGINIFKKESLKKKQEKEQKEKEKQLETQPIEEAGIIKQPTSADSNNNFDVDESGKKANLEKKNSSETVQGSSTANNLDAQASINKIQSDQDSEQEQKSEQHVWDQPILILQKQEEEKNEEDNEQMKLKSAIKITGDQEQILEEMLPKQEGDNQTEKQDSEMSEELKLMYKKEARKLPWEKVILVVGILAFQILCSLLQGGKQLKSIAGIELCGDEYYVVLGSFGLLCVIFTLGGCYLNQQSYKKKALAGFHFEEGDVRWPYLFGLKYGFISLIAGLFAGLFGIGGGPILNPMMLQMGVLPEIARSTTSTLILITSLSLVIEYSIAGAIISSYAIPLTIITFICSSFGVVLIRKLVKRFGRQSLLVFLLVLTILLVTAATIAKCVTEITSAKEAHEDIWLLGAACQIKKHSSSSSSTPEVEEVIEEIAEEIIGEENN